MATYIIRKSDPFVIKGAKGQYEIPIMTELTFDGLAEVVTIQQEQDYKKRWRKIKAFLLAMVPELENEHLADAEYISIYSAYENYKPEEAGESSASQDGSLDEEAQ